MNAVLELHHASLTRSGKQLWSGVDLQVTAGEFLAVLGPNGAGKTSLLKVLLGVLPLTSGQVRVGGAPLRRGSRLIGYLPQRATFDSDLSARARDLVALGVDGDRFGPSWPARSTRHRVDAALAAVGATGYATVRIGQLSGGEQQRVRIAQALVADPAVLLCDEPLLSLDLNHQRGVVELIDARRRSAATAVVMVTHEINPVLPLVDRILYMVDGRCVVGTPEQVLTSQCLSGLFGTQIDVMRVRGRIIVVGGDSPLSTHPHLGIDHGPEPVAGS